MNKDHEINRRALLSGACALLVLTGLGALPASANTGIRRLGNGRVSVKLKSLPELSKIGGSVGIGNVKGKPVAITRTGNSSYVAFSLSCPHQGVKLSWEENGWICDAHGSEFKADGELVLGPATTRLPRVPMKIAKGVATVG
ncbi:MAG: ubiquinol-cytochrome c reductase iron-sulfur subunit [Candidatus Nanopelagicaceae bacterium]|jgi:Rieske Fe-S protein